MNSSGSRRPFAVEQINHKINAKLRAGNTGAIKPGALLKAGGLLRPQTHFCAERAGNAEMFADLSPGRRPAGGRTVAPEQPGPLEHHAAWHPRHQPGQHRHRNSGTPDANRPRLEPMSLNEGAAQR